MYRNNRKYRKTLIIVFFYEDSFTTIFNVSEKIYIINASRLIKIANLLPFFERVRLTAYIKFLLYFVPENDKLHSKQHNRSEIVKIKVDVFVYDSRATILNKGGDLYSRFHHEISSIPVTKDYSLVPLIFGRLENKNVLY